MTQILVTVNEDVTTKNIRKAIELLKGVVSTKVFKAKSGNDVKTLKQQTYVKDSLERAFGELNQAGNDGTKLQTADDFIKELKSEVTV